MSFFRSLIPKHRACCDLANETHIHLMQSMRQRDALAHEVGVLEVQLAEQRLLTESLTRFVSVLHPGDLDVTDG